MAPIPGGPGESTYWWDKVPSKFEGWGENRFREAGFRAVPNCIVGHSAYIAPGVILMPSFLNLGPRRHRAPMVHTSATAASLPQPGQTTERPPGRQTHAQ